ncbi:MAG: Inner membrane protein YidH [Stenotrophomonas maltophilia]|nr:MAG: Inner membrane protein YidH [Stenotrophomonas maltophilia]
MPCESRRGAFAERLLGGGQEPDPRFSLANERTFLAWIRTAMALLAGAMAIDALVEANLPGAWRGFLAALLAGLGLLTAALAWSRTQLLGVVLAVLVLRRLAELSLLALLPAAVLLFGVCLATFSQRQRYARGHRALIAGTRAHNLGAVTGLCLGQVLVAALALALIVAGGAR